MTETVQPEIEDEPQKPKLPPGMKVGLFVTCLADLMRPSIAFSALRLLEQLGVQVEVPETQTCCGQPGANSGIHKGADKLAQTVIETFLPYQALVVPSGSCADEIKNQYPKRFAKHAHWGPRAIALSHKTFELSEFLVRAGYEPEGRRFERTACYHDTCSAYRGLGVGEGPRALLDKVEGLHLTSMQDPGQCCGFGGTFAAKFPEISAAMGTKKIEQAGGADMIIGGDWGCLMHMQGLAEKQGRTLRVCHTAEVLAGMVDEDGEVCP